jgi:hypothetical protein
MMLALLLRSEFTIAKHCSYKNATRLLNGQAGVAGRHVTSESLDAA